MNNAASQPILELKNISVHYGGVKALDGAHIALAPGEIVALMGPNGAGKSTILKVIFGLAPIDKGQVKWEGKAVTPLSFEMVERGVAFVPQGKRVFTYLTVQENLEIGAYTVNSKSEIKRRITEVMELFPILKEKRKKKAGTLSGGQQQMLALGRGLMTDPKVLLLDEPSLGLSPKVTKEVFAAIKEINQKRNTAIMVVEHNIKSLLEIVDRAYVLDKGQVVAEDNGQAIIKSDVLEKVFLGQLEQPV